MYKSRSNKKRHPFYGTHEWQKTRSKVICRDGYRCRSCGKSVRGKGEAHVDHVIPRKERPDLALDMRNLQTLCTTCHNSLKRKQELMGPRDDAVEVGASGEPTDPDSPWYQ